MSLLKIFLRNLSDLWRVRQRFLGIFFTFLPIDALEHRHKDDPIFECF